MTPQERSAKPVTRRAVRASRSARQDGPAAAVEEALAGWAASALAAALAAGRGPVAAPGPGQEQGPPTVAAYRSLAGEPGTGALRAELRGSGHRVLLPVLLPDLDLDWVLDQGPVTDGGSAAGPDPLRPTGPRLGADALAACTLVLVPALAVDAAGTRLGQGGGSYDRALARLPAGPGRPLVLAVVHDEELVDGPLPREPHDVAVDGALTPSGLVLLPR